MRNRVVRGLLALSTVLALLLAVPVSTASADGKGTIHQGDRVCSMYVNSNGFGAYCSNTTSGGTNCTSTSPCHLPTWRELMQGPVFIPCRDFTVPDGITLPPPPQGKTWVLRLTIVDYNLDAHDGGDNAHIERAIVPVSDVEKQQCPVVGYMDRFWNSFREGYPAPVLLVNPTYTPRVNVPAFFALTPESSYILKNGPSEDAIYYGGGHLLTMRAVVSRMIIDPGDGTKPFSCLMGTTRIDDNGYDKNSDPFHQMNMCKYTYKRSSANQPDGMYTVKLTIVWQVDYWRGEPGWTFVGNAEVHAVQRLPVQEVQTIGG